MSFYMMSIGTGDCLVQPSLTNLQDANVGLKWGFVDYVDFIGMILGILLTVTDGTTQSAAGLQADSVINICNDLVMQTGADGYPWSSMCLANTTGTPIRVLSGLNTPPRP
ncbi:hypothetical protein B0J13DRAFT_566434 [Dactylonectria estremocensis]|uniref:GH64 domain-containing protein n=1 Tax=Dactylonectria estremocensis TaxID=1079267 RepID=A0A9P9DQB9_9HYPO|nr:hypothetical protein B0J13DRAFT_566434 [Dactylonectria estremocensis]